MNASFADPPLGGTVGYIRSLLPSLVPSERRVAQECIDNPEAVMVASTADMASRTETSPATVIRASQNLGFRGFQHLRILLVRDLGAASRAEAGPLADGTEGRVQGLFSLASRTLNEAIGVLDYAQFDGAVAAVSTAKRLLIVANGGSGPSAQMAAMRFMAADRPCEAPYDAITQHLSARTLGEGDVLLAISDSGLNALTLRAVDAARIAGATVVGLTSYARSPLSEQATFSLVAGATFSAWDQGAVSASLTQILLLSALQDEVGRHMEAAADVQNAVMHEVYDYVVADPDVQQ